MSSARSRKGKIDPCPRLAAKEVLSVSKPTVTLKRGVRRTGNCSKRCEPSRPISLEIAPLFPITANGPAGKNHLDRVRRIGRQPGGQQTVCEKTTDALERARRPPFAANPQVLNGDWRATLSRCPRMKVMPEIKTA